MANGNGTTNGTSAVKAATRHIRRNVPFLDQLSPGGRRAYEQEMLDQACTFRQIAAARNGVPGVIDRNLVQNMDEELTNSTESTTTTDTPAAVGSMPGWLKTLLATLGIAGAGLGGWAVSGLVSKPTPTTPPAATVSNDIEMLKWLQMQGMGGGPEQTDLGSAIRQAANLDPSLRSKILDMVQQTLDKAPK